MTDDIDHGKALFDLVERLIGERPFGTAQIERLFGGVIRRNEKASTEYFDVFHSELDEPVNGVSRVEIRVPTASSDKADGMVILSVGDDPCLTRDAVPSWLGEGKPEIPRPGQPSSAKVYTTHAQDWGVISIGFAATGERCIRSVVLNATKAP